MQVNNLGTSDATNIVSTYTIGPGLKLVGFNAIQPGTLTFNNLTNTITWTINHLGGNSYAAASVLLESLTTGTGNNFALNASIISCDQNITNPNYQKSNTILTISPSSDIQVTQTVNNTNPQPGNYVTITITTTNNGPDNATGISITDLLPTGLTVDTDPNTSITTTQGTYNTTTGIWNIGNLTNTATATLTIIARDTATTGTTLTNTAATNTLTQYDWNTENNSNQTYITTT